VFDSVQIANEIASLEGSDENTEEEEEEEEELGQSY
jgi:hypothetical protein